MQRRIDGADRDRLALHLLEHAVEVAALQRQQLVERGAAILLVVGQDHALDDGDAPFAEEHVLGAAEADAARAERVGELRLIGQVGIGAHAHAAELVGPRKQLVEALDRWSDSPGFILPASTCRISLGCDATCASLTSPVSPSNDTKSPSLTV